jgi:nitroreductase
MIASSFQKLCLSPGEIMHVHEAIRTRRAVKNFDPQHKISSEQQSELLDLAMQSPSAFNLQHWRFVVVDDMELRKKIRAVAWDQHWQLAGVCGQSLGECARGRARHDGAGH